MTLKSNHQPAETTPLEAAKNKSAMNVINHGGGGELLSLRDLKGSGSHPFSNSTRRRKIQNNEYPTPIKISPQMCLWKAGDIRLWREDPNGFKSNQGAKNV